MAVHSSGRPAAQTGHRPPAAGRPASSPAAGSRPGPGCQPPGILVGTQPGPRPPGIPVGRTGRRVLHAHLRLVSRPESASKRSVCAWPHARLRVVARARSVSRRARWFSMRTLGRPVGPGRTPGKPFSLGIHAHLTVDGRAGSGSRRAIFASCSCVPEGGWSDRVGLGGCGPAGWSIGFARKCPSAGRRHGHHAW